MSLAAVGGGYQVGSGSSEVNLGYQGAPTTYTTTATITAAELATGILNNATNASYTITLPTVALWEALVVNAKTNSSFDFAVINTGNGTITLAGGTGWTGVGTLTVATTLSALFRARKTGDSAWSVYRIG
jgi:hypothetical protein